MGGAGGKDAEHRGSATREWQAAELEALYQAAPVALAVIDREHRLVRINDRMAAINGQSAADSIGRRGDEAVPEVAAQINPLVERVFATGEPVMEAEIRGRTPGSHGQERTWLCSYAPLRGASGEVEAVQAVAQDITERKCAQAQLETLVAELSHRVKNTLATVQTIATGSLGGDAATDAARRHFDGRLQALARTHTLLAETGWRGADLHALALAELAPYGERAHLTGTAIALSPRAALILGMALHELATNAARHGALRVPEGRVALAWRSVEGDHGTKFRLDWRESGGPTVRVPAHRGFGLGLIDRGVPYELGGAVRLDFAELGLRCALEIPAAEALVQ